MKTRVLRVDASHPDPRVIGEAVHVLRGGGLVAFPTETVYGLGARALDDQAIARIFIAKRRPSGHPIIAHVAGESDAKSLAASFCEAASRLARAFWPGPLTLVVPRAAHVPARIGGGGDSIAVRAPSHSVARSLLQALGEPIAAPSANPYQALSPTRAAHVLAGLDGRIDLLLDGGPSECGIESTVVEVRVSANPDGDEVVILRPGTLDEAALRAVVGRVRHEREADASPGALPLCPGLDRRHYAPRAPLHLEASSEAALARARLRSDRGERVGVVLRGSGAALAKEGLRYEARMRIARLPDTPAAYARALYATLHDLDDGTLDAIVVEAVPTGDAWRAIADRLTRASAR